MTERIIESLYKTQLNNNFNLPPIHEQVGNWLNQEAIDLNDLMENFIGYTVHSMHEKTVDKWKSLLTINLLNFLSPTRDDKFSRIIRQHELQPWNQSSQYFRLYVALNHFLAQMPVPEVGVHLLESGAALIDLKEYSPWLSMPYHPQHLEFGILLSLLGIFLKRSDIEENISRLATWQINTLDYHLEPFPGLYTRESENNHVEIILLHYLLFRGAAAITKKPQFVNLSHALGIHLKEKFNQFQMNIDPLWVIVEQLFCLPKVELTPIILPHQIHDSSTSLVGYRSDQQTAVCTLHGCHTGIGYMREHDVEIMNYGPQYFPLDNCEGFGIEGNHLSDHGIRQSFMQSHQAEFSLKGCVRFVDQPLNDHSEKELYRGIWLEVLQEYINHQLHIKSTFLGLDGWDSVAFCFFVKAQQCQVNQNLVLFPGQLDRYEGDIVPLRFHGLKGALELRSLTQKGQMQVIPVAGGNNFWGSNFLVAYTLDSGLRDYHWSIEPLHKKEFNKESRND